MNLRIKGKFTTISKPTLPKIKPAARVMKPERQAAVDSIPPAKAGVTPKKSHSSAESGGSCSWHLHRR